MEAEFEVLDVRQVSCDPVETERAGAGHFAAPGVYPAVVRFANADGGHRRDRWPDVRAMSFSIDVPPGVVPGTTRLDFSMNSTSTFPLNDSHVFAVAVRVLSAEGMGAKWKALRSLTWSEFRRPPARDAARPPAEEGHAAEAVSAAPLLEHGAVSPTAAATPSGTWAIPADNPARPLQAGPDRLQDELVRHVNEDAQMSAFDFALQLLEPGRMTHGGRTQEASFWVENAAVEWNERESPFHVVASLRLRPKSVLSARAETFSIDVTGHSTPDSRPIGSINRARGHAESASRAARLAQPVVFR